MISPRRFRLLLLVVWGFALLAGAGLVSRGEWAQFGSFLAGLPASWKAGGPRRVYLAHWVLPMLLVYLVMLSGGIFFGLRRLRRGAR
jgi:hypothetical protein